MSDEGLSMLVIAILVKRLGGNAKITQEDIDDIAFNHLEEIGYGDGALEFRLITLGQVA